MHLAGSYSYSAFQQNYYAYSSGATEIRSNRRGVKELKMSKQEPKLFTFEELHEPKKYEEYHEDNGNVLWFLIPICEPPYGGMPDDPDWPFRFSERPELFWVPLPNAELIMESWVKKYGGKDASQLS